MADTALLAGAPCTLSDTDPHDNYPGMVLVQCRQPSIALITFACGHEHVDRALACAGCVAEVQQCEDVLVCPRCEDGPEPHECPAFISIEWIAGQPGETA